MLGRNETVVLIVILLLLFFAGVAWLLVWAKNTRAVYLQKTKPVVVEEAV